MSKCQVINYLTFVSAGRGRTYYSESLVPTVHRSQSHLGISAYNIAVIYNSAQNTYRVSPLFDNGLALLADTNTDFILDKSIKDCMELLKAKPFSMDFDEQAEEAASHYGWQLKLQFSISDVNKELDEFKNIYNNHILERVEKILSDQIRRYQYLFS